VITIKPPRSKLDPITADIGFLEEDEWSDDSDVSVDDELEEDDGVFWGQQIFPL